MVLTLTFQSPYAFRSSRAILALKKRRFTAKVVESAGENKRKIDKSLCVLRVLSGKFCVFLQNHPGA
jgi:hypothetical protein